MKRTLFKKSKSGKIQVWAIEVDNNMFRTIEGYKDGALTETAWTICEGKRIGKANATTSNEQALKEAEAKIKKQKDKGWTDNIGDIDAAKPKIAPMLAHKWEDYKDYALICEDLYSQPKLDGIRCIATIDGLFTRNGKPIVAAPHIFAAVKDFIREMDEAGLIVQIDGELYNHQLKNDFNEIASIVRKQKVTEEDLVKSQQYLQYHIYDINIVNRPDAIFHYRYNLLIRFMADNCVQLVPTTFAHGAIDLDVLYGKYLEEGYEGQMIRTNACYQNSRTKDLLKRKEFVDEEFEIIDIEEGKGNRAGMMGRIKFNGFDANARGSHEYFKELLLNKHKYIGKKATVRYQNLTPDGKPRFPVVIDIGRIDL